MLLSVVPAIKTLSRCGCNLSKKYPLPSRPTTAKTPGVGIGSDLGGNDPLFAALTIA